MSDRPINNLAIVLQSEYDELRAENERLRAALQQIASECTMFVWGDIAREALAGDDDDSDDGCGAVHS